MLDIYVDADACPVKEDVYRVAERHGLKVFVVANTVLRIPARVGIECVVAGGGSDAADDWIAAHIQKDDIAITADIPLAARCLEKAAHVLDTHGRELTRESIGSALASRELMERLRETGVASGGPAPFTPKDRSRFLSRLETMVRQLRRPPPP